MSLFRVSSNILNLTIEREDNVNNIVLYLLRILL